MTSQKKTYIIHILMIIGLVLPALIPVGSWVLAQEELKHFSPQSFILTSDFGIESPAGMAYSSEADSFIVWAADNAFHVIAPQDEMGVKLNLAQSVENPLGLAFEDQSNSLFILSSSNTELAKIDVGQGGLPDASNESATRFNIKSFDLQDAQGITFDPATGRLFILDARRLQVLMVSSHPTQGFDGASAAANNRVLRLSLESLSQSQLRGIAFNPNNGHLYIGSPNERKVYELKENGERVSTYDVTDLNLENPATMLFAPSGDVTDDPNIMDLYILDSGLNSKQGSATTTDQSSTSQKGQIVELSLQAPAALPSGTTLLPATLVHTIDTSKAAWNPSAPDPAGIDYWPLTGKLLIVDSEVDEMPTYWMGKNVFHSTTSGVLSATCTTTSFTGEPTGVAINPNNNHIFFSTDFNDRIFEVGLGLDGIYCTSDDTVTATSVATLYNVKDAEDVAYGNNTLFVAGGDNAEVYSIPLGANGVLGGGDDGAMTHFDTAALGFSDMESLGYNANSNTLFLASPKPSERYLGETTTSGTLLRAYDLSFMGTAGNIRSDVTYAPGSQNPAIKSIYIAARGVDNDDSRYENDGKVWEVRLSSTITPTPTVPAFAHVNVTIGGSPVGSHDVPLHSGMGSSYPGVDKGPVTIMSTNGPDIVAAMRVIWQEPGYRSSYSELMGLPKEQLSTEYWFPWYNNATPSMDQAFRIGNVDSAATTIEVSVGTTVIDSFPLGSGASTRKSYHVDSGPIKVHSVDDRKILAAMRVIWQEPGYRSSYSELMGLPKEQLSNEYWFPWYNNATPSMDQAFRIANVDSAATTIEVSVGTTVIDSFPLGSGASTRKSYHVDSGPIKIRSLEGRKILAAMRVIWEEPGYRSSYSELMGLPKEQLSNEYWFPWYSNVDTNSMDQGFRIASVNATGANTIQVWVGNTIRESFTLLAGTSVRKDYPVNSGPIHIVCTTCSLNERILTSLRVIWQEPPGRTSYSEMMGLPKEQLSTEYWFPWYNNATPSMDQAFRISVP